MPRFHFHVREFGRLLDDPEGIDLPSLAAAHNEAVKAAREIMCEKLMSGKNPVHSRFEISDDAGNLVLVVAFADAYGDD
jgi:hypothetical protein